LHLAWGGFLEVRPGVEFDIREAGTATSVVTLAASDLQGTYAPDHGPGTCLQAVQLDVTVTGTRISGSLVDTVPAASCDAVTPTTGVSPHTSATFDTPSGPCSPVQGGLFDAARACFGPLETVAGVCLRELAPGETAGTGQRVCLVGPAGETYVVSYGYTQTLAASGWHVEGTFPGGNGSPLERLDLTTPSCLEAMASVPPDDGGVSVIPGPVAGTCP
jgi:hypothetical protein